MKKITLSVLAFIVMPISVYVAWQLTGMIFNFAASSITMPIELSLVILEGFLIPFLMLFIIFKVTQNSSDSHKAVRICGIIGCIITIILVLIALPWIKLGIAFRGVRM
jgi:hypothetical protein